MALFWPKCTEFLYLFSFYINKKICAAGVFLAAFDQKKYYSDLALKPQTVVLGVDEC
jgi:hypothetical protein